MEIEENFFASAAAANFHRFYERLGDVFYDAVDRAMGQLRRFPESESIYEDPVRRLAIHGTPLGLFDVLQGRRRAIVAILDLRQNPDVITRRLGM